MVTDVSFGVTLLCEYQNKFHKLTDLNFSIIELKLFSLGTGIDVKTKKEIVFWGLLNTKLKATVFVMSPEVQLPSVDYLFKQKMNFSHDNGLNCFYKTDPSSQALEMAASLC